MLYFDSSRGDLFFFQDFLLSATLDILIYHIHINIYLNDNFLPTFQSTLNIFNYLLVRKIHSCLQYRNQFQSFHSELNISITLHYYSLVLLEYLKKNGSFRSYLKLIRHNIPLTKSSVKFILSSIFKSLCLEYIPRFN